MKLSRWITLSLLFNLSLLTAVGYVAQRRSAATARMVTETDVVTEVTTKVVKKEAGAPVVVNVPAGPFTWRLVEAAEYKPYIANLRAIECPEETIRDIITADVDKLYAKKIKALHHNAMKGYQYWQAGVNPWANMDQEAWKQQRVLEKEKRALLIELLGVDPQKEKNKLYGNVDWQEQMYPFLSEDKREKTQAIQEKYQDLEQAIYRKYKGYYGEEMQAELKKVRNEQKAELAGLLTPYEMDEYALRNSQTANQMNWEMRTLDPDEQEFRKLYKIKSVFDDQFSGFQFDPDDKEAQAKYNEARKAMNEEIKGALGDARYTEYTRSQDYNYQQLARLADREGLPKGTAGKVYDMKAAAEEQAQKIRSDTTLNAADRKQALAAIQQETEQAVTQTLGDKAYGKYKDRNGWWIRSLTGR